jgi:hypothetical protein
MRAVLLGSWLLLALAAPAAAAPVFEDPAGLVAYAYQAYESEDPATIDHTDLYSPSLSALFELDAERTPEGELGALDFDPFVNGQDYRIEDLAIGEPAIDGDQAIVTATFTNLGEPQEMRFTLVRRVEGWKIDDIEALAGSYQWRLSELLAADPLLN